MENFYVQIYEACFRKDICYQSFSQNTKAAFNNAFVRRCKKSCIFSLAAFRTLGLSTRIRKPHFLPQNHASGGSYKMRRIVVWDFEVVTFSWTPRPGGQPPLWRSTARSSATGPWTCTLNTNATPPVRSESSAIPAEARCECGTRTGSSAFR